MFHFRQRYVRTRVWDTEANPNLFPELHDPDYAVDWVEERRNFGVAFSGGEIRDVVD